MPPRSLAMRSRRAAIAAALVRAHRAKLPSAEVLLDDGPGQKPDRQQGPRPGFEDTMWFRMDVGRRHNADPRWILPLLCRRGHITKSEIGAIRNGPNETLFEVPRAAVGRFMDALKRTAPSGQDGEQDVRIEPAQGAPPRDAGAQNRPARARGGPPAKVYRPRPTQPRRS